MCSSDLSGPSDESLADLAGEIANQVCGALKLAVAKLGLKVIIGLPKVVTGVGHGIIHLVKNPVMVVPVMQGRGRCTLEFCMSRTTAEDLKSETEAASDLQSGALVLF